jgi:hypothetical protein
MPKYKRLKEMCRTVWTLLTEEEREHYLNNVGTVRFIRDVSRILDIDSDYLIAELFDDILGQL